MAEPWSLFLDGAAWPMRGARTLMGRPALWLLVLVPALITATLLGAGVAGVWWGTPWLLASLLPLPPDAPRVFVFVWWVLAGVLMLSLGTVVVVGAWLASGLVATPFLDQLSDHVERMERGRAVETTRWTLILVDVGWSVVHSVFALLLWTASMGALLVVGLIPAVGAPAELVLSLLVTAWLVAREMMDGPMSRRRFGFAHKLRVVWANRFTALGFGLVVAALLWLPLLNFLVLPIAVAGGTRMFLALEDQGRVPGRDRSPTCARGVSGPGGAASTAETGS